MYSQKEIDDIKSQRRRLRTESSNDDNDTSTFQDNTHSSSPNDQNNDENVEHQNQQGGSTRFDDDDKDVKSLDEEFVNELGKMNDNEDKFDDAWLKSLKTSDTDVVYEKGPPKKTEKKSNMDELYDLPRVEVIRLLVSMLEDEESPSDYLKSKKFKEKAESDAKTSPYEVSDLAHVLTMTWQNVYFMSKEEIVEALMNYKNNSLSNRIQNNLDKELKNYEFRWVKDELAVHGPYPHEDILMWIVYGYVSDENPILVRELDNYGNPLTTEWTKYKDSDIYNIFPPTKNSLSEPADTSAEDQNKEEDDENDQDVEEGFSRRKRQKLIGVRIKDKEEDYEESDEEQLE